MIPNVLQRAGIAALTVLVLASCSSTTMRETGFLDRTVVLDGVAYPYVVYVPRNWTPKRAWPVILFLHGAGERGSDGHRQTQIGLGAAIRALPERIPAIAVFPQAPAEKRWLGRPADAAMRALDSAVAEFHGDRGRLYLTGLSLGGFGTWHLALAHPHTFAALVPVCGGIVPHGSATSVRQSPLTADAGDPYRFTAERLHHIPVWIFHGADDPVILPSESQKMRDAFQAAGGEVRYTEYPGVGHNAWEPAYREAELWTWLFSKKLDSPAH
jgi:predicted peptidase